MQNVNELRAKLIEYKEKNDFLNYELARKLDTTEANISRWLNGGNISRAWQKIIISIIEE